MRKIYVLGLLFLCGWMGVNAQSTANYTASTSVLGSLALDRNGNTVDMTTGTSSLIGAGLDATASTVTSIGFDFFLMSNYFSQFSVNEDGILQLGATAVGTNIYTISGGTTALPRLSAFNADLRTGTTTGKVHYKVVGTAPNRCLVVEFANMQLFYTSTAAAGTSTWQMRFYENTGIVEYVYGAMNVTSVTAGTRSPSIGFYTGAATGAFVSILYAGPSVSTTSPYAANPTISATGNIPNLNSAANGSRRIFTLTPPGNPSHATITTLAPPTGLTSSSTLSTVTLNWTAASPTTGILKYAIYQSNNGGSTYSYVGTVPVGTNTATVSGLTPATTYFFKVYSLSEGYLSTALTSAGITTASCPAGAQTFTINNTLPLSATNFPSFTSAINYVNGLATCTLSGNILFNVAAGQTFTENPPFLTTGGTATFSVTFQKSGAGANPNVNASGSTGTEAALGIIGGDYITFDGIDVTTPSTTLEYGYYIQNTSATNGAQNNTIKNCSITLNRTNGLSVGIVSLIGTTPTNATGANSNNKFYNFLIKNSNTGIQLTGNVTFPDLNCEIGTTACNLRNVIGDAAVANDISSVNATWGIRATNQAGVKIFNNDISNITSTSAASTADGIWFDSSVPGGTVSLGVSDINNNQITAIITSAASGASISRGIRVNNSASASTITRVFNNFISNIQTNTVNATVARRVIGINLQPAGSGAGSTINTEFNSVSLNVTTVANISSACYEIGSASGPVFKTRNNIFANLTAAQTGVPKHYAYVSSSATSNGPAGTVSNYNDLYIANASNGFVGLGNTTDYANLANFQTAFGTDANSQSVDPQFTSATDLHSAALLLDGAADPAYATNTAFVTNDIDCTTRPATTDIGADEFTITGCTGAVGGTATITGASTFCASGTPTITATGYSTGTGSGYQWEMSNDNFATNVVDVTGQTSPSTLSTGVITSTTYYRLRVTCTSGLATAYSNIITVTINPRPTVVVTPSSGSFCNPGGTAVTLTASGATTYAWSPAAGLNTTTGATVMASPTATTTYTVTGTDGNGCTNTATAIITVNGAVSLTSVTATPATICSGATSTLTASGNIANSSYTVSAIGSPALQTPGAATVTTLSTAASFPVNTNGTAGDDSYSNPITLPFAFNYFGTAVTQFWVSTNGYITFVNPSTISASNQRVPQTLPTTTNPNGVVALFWHDMDIRTLGNVNYYVTGTSPNQKMVIEFNGEPTFGSTTALHTGQIVLYEQSNIDIIVSASPVATKSLGLENSTGTVGVSPSGRNNVSWTVTATEGWAFTPPVISYAWTPAGDVVNPSSQTTLTNPLTATETFTVVASAGGCSASGTVTVTVATGAAITTNPSSTTKCAGQTATFTVVATGPALTYQWRKNGVDIPIGSNASAGTATLTLTNITSADAATYDVVVSSTCGSPVTSAGATLTVNAVPTATASSNTPVCTGSTLTLTGTTDIGTSFSWTGPNGFTSTVQNPTISNVTMAAAGVYSFTATASGCPSVVSTTTVVVNQTPSAVTITPATATICSGSSVSLTASGGSTTGSGNATLGTATTLTGATTQPTAFCNRWAQYWNQTIYTAAELSAAGLSTGSSISSVAYTTTTQGDANNNTNFSIRIGNTASTVLSAFQTTGLSVVYGPSTYTHVVGINTITFATPFVWDGTSNIILDVRQDGVDLANNAITYFTAASDNKNFEAHTSTTSSTTSLQTLVANASVTGTASTTRLNIVLAYSTVQAANFTWSPATGLNTTTGATVIASPTSTQTYTATSTINGCSSSNTATVTVTPTANAGTVSGPTPLCNGATATYTVSGTTLSGGTGAFSSTNTAVATVNAASGVVTVVGYGTTNITYTITGGCGSPVSSFQTLTVNPDTYLGTSSDWTNSANWSCGVPTATTDVLIPGGLAFYPIVATGTAMAHNVNIATGGMITVNMTGEFALYGAITNAGIFDLTDGTLNLAGAGVTVAGPSILNASVKNLVISNSGTSSVTAGTNNMLTLTNLMSFATSGNTLNTNGNLTFASTAANTASLSDITAGGTYSGNAVTGNAYVERFIPATRKWRYLSPNTLVGTNSTNTVKETWMENQTNTANRGMWITDPAGTAQGFDAASPGATMKWWNGASYTPITNPTTYDIRQHPAYFTYVRGDRTATGTNQVNTTTRLRTYGELAQGSSSYTVAGSMTGIYKEAGNPYASAIDLTKLTYSTTGPINIYVWDPKLAGAADLGAFQQLNMDPSIGETHFTITPGGGSYGDAGSVMDTLESGLGYFIQSSAAPRTVTYNETAKTLSNHTFSFTPVVLQKVLGTLAIRETNGTLTTVDGLQVKMHGSYNTALDPNDAVKLSNTSENIAVMRENTALALEYRNFALPINDTVFINIANMRFKDYRWSFTLTNLDAPGRTGFLIDQFTGVETQLNLTGGNTYNFTVNATAGSYATGRFMIVFRQAAVLAARKLSIAAQRQADGNIAVKWTAENETDVLHYELERSANGTTFNKIGGNTNATNNAGGNAAYTQNDATPVSGDNYYRVKGLSDNGPTQYSSIVKVAAITKAGTIAVRPNPVVNKTVQLYAENMEAGNYQVVVRAANGQTVYSGSMSMVAGTNQRSITLNRSAAQGEYSVSVVSAGGVKYAVRITVLD